MEDFLFMADKQIARDVLKEFSNQGLNIKLGCNLTDAKSTAKKVNVTYQSSEGEQKDSFDKLIVAVGRRPNSCLLYTSPSPRDKRQSRMPSSA